MLDQLLETKQATQRRAGGTLVSVVLHLLVIGGAFQLTHHSVAALPKPEETRVRFQPAKPVPVTPRPAPPPDAIATQRSAFGHAVLRAPAIVPLDIPSIDLSAARTDPTAFAPQGVAGGRPDGAPGGDLSPSELPMLPFEVDKAAAALAGSARPAYPDMLKASGVEGEALVQFVVDTLGRAEPGTFTVLSASHDAFATSVGIVLPRMRFLPAESGGRKVRMLVRQRFAFTLDR